MTSRHWWHGNGSTFVLPMRGLVGAQHSPHVRACYKRSMRSGCRAAGVVGIMLSFAGCMASPAATPSTVSQPLEAASIAPAAAPATPSSDGPSAGRDLRVDISSAGVAVDGENVGSDQLDVKAALLKAGAGAIDVHAKPDASPALVLAALTLDAGPHVVRRLLSWQDVTLEVAEQRSSTRRNFGDPIPAAIFSWHANRATQLWSVSAGPAVTNLGPFEPGDQQAEPAAVSALGKACSASGCAIIVELREEHLLESLRAWQRIVAAVGPRLGLHVSSPPPPPLPLNAEREALGRLPPALIQDVVRIGFPRFKGCYEGGLSRDPKLEGKVLVRFVIERDGTVRGASDGGSDLPDVAVRDCVIHQFTDFKFPAPGSGIVTVVYPILLAPG